MARTLRYIDEPTPQKAPAAELRIRWAGSYDLPAIREIDNATIDPWGDHAIRETLRDVTTMGVVAEYPDNATVVGFRVVTFLADCIRLEYLAVHPEHRRRGIARELVQNLEHKIRRHEKRSRVVAHVPGWALDLHLTLAACGYVARWVDHEFDTYFFDWHATDKEG